PTTMSLDEDLPFELISKIFTFCIPRYGRIRPDPQCAPLLLLQICRRWRTIALATPWLWNSIFLECSRGSGSTALPILFGDESAPSIHPIASLVDLWFSRCDGFPLSITLLSQEIGVELPDGLKGVIQSKCSQWNRLELSLERKSLVDLLCVEGPFPLLQSLAIGNSNGEPLSFEMQRDVYLKSPALKILRMRNSYIDPLFRSVMAGGSKPHTVELSRITVDVTHVTDLFTLLPELRHLTLHIHHPAGVLSGIRTLSLPFLETLVVEGTVDFLAYVSAPALVDLGVTVWNDREANIVVSFVSHSGCALNGLSLRNATISHSTWTILLRVFRILDAHKTASLTRVYIRILKHLNWGGNTVAVPAPTPEVLGRFRQFRTRGLAISLETPDFRWPVDAANEVEPDFNIFQPEEPMPFSI
ncbi:F-box domain-containing protein, partial [Favolaschia claudopus]